MCGVDSSAEMRTFRIAKLPGHVWPPVEARALSIDGVSLGKVIAVEMAATAQGRRNDGGDLKMVSPAKRKYP